MMNPLAQHARAIFAEALARVDVRRAVLNHLRGDASGLTFGDRVVPFVALDSVLVVAAGKAAVAMHEAAREALAGCPVPCRAIVVGPAAPPALDPGSLFFPGSHPTPDQGSLEAADAVLALLRSATPRTAVLFLLSGGASAMLERPLDCRLSLTEVAAFHRALVASGLSIAQMNTVRKHVSGVKGGRLAKAAAPALAQHTLLLSDVPSGTPDTIGSGPSLPDPSTLADCADLLRAIPALPAAITRWLTSPDCPETPKPSDATFARAAWTTILSSDDLAEAAARAARDLGFQAHIDNTCDDWEYRDAARYLLDRSAKLAYSTAAAPPHTCLISVGELSVALPPNPGEGGRNQHFALWCAAELARTQDRATILSAGSDGIDGHSLAAGAVCDETTVFRARTLGLSAEAALGCFNSAPLFRALGDEILTGPTGNNLRDLRLVIR